MRPTSCGVVIEQCFDTLKNVFAQDRSCMHSDETFEVGVLLTITFRIVYRF
jgi:hypothetical protein